MNDDDIDPDEELLKLVKHITAGLAETLGYLLSDTPLHFALVVYEPKQGAMVCSGSEPRGASIDALRAAVKKMSGRQAEEDAAKKGVQ